MTAQRSGRLGVGVVGMGHVGPVLASALRAAGHSLVGVSASSDEARERADAMLPDVPILEVPDLVERCELVLLTVPDDALGGLVEGLASLGAWQAGQLVVHTSGAFGVGILDPARTSGAIPLAIHPAMTFTGTSVDVSRLVGTPFAVTAPGPVLPIGQALVVEMGGEPVIVEEEHRVLYHAGLAHASNHLVTLVSQAARVLSDAGIEDPGAYLRPLLDATLDRALREGAAGLSGPVARGDSGTVARHIGALLGQEDLQDVADTYAQLARATVRMLEATHRISERAATEILSALVLGGE